MMTKARVSHRVFGIMVFLVFWGVIGIGMVAGVWESKMPGIDPESLTLPDEIKGWMTVEDILCAFDLDRGQFFSALGLPPNTDLKTKVKDMGKDLGFETEKVREVVAQLLGVPLEAGAEPADTAEQDTAEQDTAEQAGPGSQKIESPGPTTPAPESNGSTAPEVTSESSGPASNGAEPRGPEAPSTGESGTPKGDGTGTPPKLAPGADVSDIRGRSTFAEVSSVFGVPVEYIFEKLGIPPSQNPGVEIKSLTATYGFEVSDVRTLVEEYLKGR